MCFWNSLVYVYISSPAVFCCYLVIGLSMHFFFVSTLWRWSWSSVLLFVPPKLSRYISTHLGAVVFQCDMLVWLQQPAQTQHSQHAQLLFEPGLTLYTSDAKPGRLAAWTIAPHLQCHSAGLWSSLHLCRSAPMLHLSSDITHAACNVSCCSRVCQSHAQLFIYIAQHEDMTVIALL